MSVTFNGTKLDPSVPWGSRIVRLSDDDLVGFNLCNANARAFLRLLEVPMGDDDELYGSMPIADMVRLVQRARTSFDYRVDLLVREPIATKGTRGPAIFVGGVDEDYFARRLAEFGELLADLIEAGADHVSWG